MSSRKEGTVPWHTPADAKGKRHSPATGRNREVILELLTRLLEQSREVLEIASGSGEHAVYFAERMPWLRWQSSDPDPVMLTSIEAWRQELGSHLLPAPLRLDVCEEPWPVEHADAIFCANMIHIAPFEATRALLRGSAKILPSGGLLILYGPFREGTKHTAESNQRFDERLRNQDPAWGLRDRFEVERLALEEGLSLQELVQMPANNLGLVFRRS